MEFLQDCKKQTNRSRIAGFIFRGLTLNQMAMELKCSRSCVSYHVKNIYQQYKAKTRSEFILNAFSKMIDKYKNTLFLKQSTIDELEKENCEIKTIISGLLFSKNSPENFNCWAIKAKKYL